MILYINGNIGSGKTSLAVAFLYSFFSNKVYDSQNFFQKKFFPTVDGIKKDKSKIYTNISGFKFEDFDGNAEFLNFDILKKCAEIHFIIHETNKAHKHIDKAINSFFDQVANNVDFDDLDTDLELLRVKRKYNFIQGFQFTHIVLLIDEVADYFVTGEPYLDKWFNYSRHLFQDMILIQNDLSTIDKSYKNDNVVSYYIKAAESENRLHPQLFKYAFFKKWLQPASEKPPVKMFWFPKWIFDKYDSGQKEVLFPKIYLYLIPFIFLLVFFIYQITQLLIPSDDVVSSVPVNVNVENNVSVKEDNNLTIPIKKHFNKSIVCFNCRGNTCFYNQNIFSFNKIKAYSDLYNFDFLYKDKYSFFVTFCYSADNSFKNLFKHSTPSRNGRSPLGETTKFISKYER